jgi:hypothetical protein
VRTSQGTPGGSSNSGGGPFTAGHQVIWRCYNADTGTVRAACESHVRVADGDRAVLRAVQARPRRLPVVRRCCSSQSLSVTLGTINDQFIRNMVTVVGEIRARFSVIRPSAFVKATLA